MNWWNSVVGWLTSTEGSRVVDNAILPFLAIIIAGVVAALISRTMAKRLLDDRDREAKASTVTSLVSAARRSIEWSALGADERAHAVHLADEAGIRLRLLPVSGSALAATWAEHEILSIRSNSATFRFQSEQTFADVRDRLVEWQTKPGRAKKLFRDEVDRWHAEDAAAGEGRGAAAPAFVPSGPVGAEASAGAAPASAGAAPASAEASAGAAPASAPADGEAEAQASAPTLPADTAPASPIDAPRAGPDAEPRTETRPDARDRLSETGTVDAEQTPEFSVPVSAHQVRRRTSPEVD